MSNSRYLIATDLDDTILSSYFSLSADSVNALIEAQEAGHVVMIATARPKCMSLPYHRAMGLRGPLSMLNGARLEHPDDPDFPAENHMISRDTVAAIVDLLKHADSDRLWLADGDDMYAYGAPTASQSYMRELFRQSNVYWSDEMPVRETNRLFGFVGSMEAGRQIIDQMADYKDIVLRLYPQSDGGCRINGSSVTADKWYSVRRAAEIYGIPTENILTFGDEENDRLMILGAGHGFAMCNGNAKLHEQALAAGKKITELPCAEGGVGHEVRKLLL